MKRSTVLFLLVTLLSIVINDNNVILAKDVDKATNINSKYLALNDEIILQKSSVPELLEDIDFLMRTIERLHPNAYSFMGKDSVNKETKNIKSKINKPMNGIEFYKTIAPLVAGLHDGHTSVLKPSDLFSTCISSLSRALFPLAVEIRDNKMYTIKTLDGEMDIPNGAQILSINDVSTEEMIQTLTRYIPGMKQEVREAWLEEEIYFLLWLHYNMMEQFEIDYQYGDFTFTKKVEGVSKKTVDDYIDKKFNNNDKYHYRIIDNDICYLDFNRFSDYSSFKIILDQMFKEIKERNINNLIIDIRDNPGGNSNLGDLLLTYIYDQPFSQVSRIDIKVSEEIGKYNSNLGQIVSENGNYVYNTEIDNRFIGRVCVLINRKSFSGSSMFASTFKDYNMGVLIGEETGGLASQYGNIRVFKLPNTNLECSVSCKYFIRPNGEETRKGVIPHFEVIQPLEDKVNGEDTVLAFAKEFIVNEYDKYYDSQEKGVGEHIKYVEIMDTKTRNELTGFVKKLNAGYERKDYDTIYQLISTQMRRDVTIDTIKNFVDNRQEGLKKYGPVEAITFTRIYGIQKDNQMINYYIEGKLNFTETDIKYKIQLNEAKEMEKESIY